MNFPSGFLAGFTLTTTLLYTAHTTHKQTRSNQSAQIRAQTDLLNYLSASTGAYDRRHLPKSSRDLGMGLVSVSDSGTGTGTGMSRREIEREREWERRRAEPRVLDVLKHKWNGEVEGLARRVLGGG